MIIAVGNGTALWYLTRATGAVTLILLTISVGLGVANVQRWQTPELPRFVVDRIHRDASLLALALLAVHILTSLADGFAPITIVDVFIPFVSAYRPIWLGLGTFASDLIIALVITSLARYRLGYSTWRAIHWLAYLCWPIAVVHGLGTGSDTKSAWMLLLTAVCVIAVIAAVCVRALSGWPANRGVRTSALSAAVLVPLGLIVWLPGGPLGTGWAKRAGTPASVLAAAGASSAAGSSGGSSSGGASGGGSSASGSSGAGPSFGSRVTPFTAQGTGTLQQSQTASGLAQVEIKLALQGTSLSALDIRIEGQPQPGGGLSMSASHVTLGPASEPGRYSGVITALQGTNLAATVTRSDGSALALTAALQLDPSGGTTATGTVSVRPSR